MIQLVPRLSQRHGQLIHPKTPTVTQEGPWTNCCLHWITLAGFILPALILILMDRSRNLATLSYLLVIVGCCLLGGLLISAAFIHWRPDIQHPLLSSSLVVIGALGSLGLGRFWLRWLKVD